MNYEISGLTTFRTLSGIGRTLFTYIDINGLDILAFLARKVIDLPDSTTFAFRFMDANIKHEIVTTKQILKLSQKARLG
jgi:hypothetical protein